MTMMTMSLDGSPLDPDEICGCPVCEVLAKHGLRDGDPIPAHVEPELRRAFKQAKLMQDTFVFTS